jgi:hypothetical protein
MSRLGSKTTPGDPVLKVSGSPNKIIAFSAASQANEAQFYVTMSRARWAMYVFTASKVALRDAVTRPSKRLSSWQLLDLVEKDRALKAELARQRVEPKQQQQEIAYER